MSAAGTDVDRSSTTSSDEAQFLTFTLGDEEYGIDILKVQEIKGYSAVTPIPNTPRHVKGVINLRGVIVPVVDLRERFGLAPVPPNRFTVIVVIVIVGRVTGLVVDAVSDVLNVSAKDIQPAPEFGGSTDVSFVRGVAKCGERLVIMLDVDRVVAVDDLGPLQGKN